MIILKKVLNNMFLCHRLPERSFFIKGKQFPLCARCTGILLGYIIGIIINIIFKVDNLLLNVFLVIPTVIDGTGQYFGHWVSNNKRRFITGIIAGIGIIGLFFIVGTYGFNHGKSVGKKLRS